MRTSKWEGVELYYYILLYLLYIYIVIVFDKGGRVVGWWLAPLFEVDMKWKIKNKHKSKKYI